MSVAISFIVRQIRHIIRDTIQRPLTFTDTSFVSNTGLLPPVEIGQNSTEPFRHFATMPS